MKIALRPSVRCTSRSGSAAHRVFSHKPFSSFFLVAGLLCLAACQSAGSAAPAGALSLTPTLTPALGKPGTPQLAEGALSPQPSAPSPAKASTPDSQPLAPGPQPGGDIVVGGLDHPDTLHPLLAASEAGQALTALVFDSLLAYDPASGQLMPRLAADWRMAGDSRSITFTLRSDARWHDGQPVVAGDVVFTIQEALNPGLDSLYGPQLSHVAEISAPDERTVVVTLDGASCPLLDVLGELPILPRHVLARPDADPIAFGRTPIGSGPFVFLDWTAEGQVRLARNDDYWGDAPHLDNWSYLPFETPAELGQALRSGRLDAGLVPPGELEGIAPPPALDVYRYPTPEFLFVAFNNDHPVLGDSRVRRALSMAVDRELLLGQVLQGAGELIAASLPATHWAADAGLQPPAYDPNGARRLLAEAGWSDTDGDGWLDRGGEPLRLPVRTNGGDRLREDVATLVAGYYRAIGVEASLQLAPWGTLVDDLFSHDFEVIVFSWQLAAEPDQSSWWLSTENVVGQGYNFVSFADDTVDRLLQEAATLPGCDASRRARLYRQVQQALAQQRPYDFLLMPYGALVTRASLHLQGVAAGPFAGPLESAAAWSIAP